MSPAAPHWRSSAGKRIDPIDVPVQSQFPNYRPIRVYSLADRINAIHWPIAQSFRKQATRMDEVSGKS
jgi:hypothetical protein